MSSNFWVIGGEFGSMNFHKLVEGSAQVQGPFKTRQEAEDAWKTVSEENRHRAGAAARDRLIARLSNKKTSKDDSGFTRAIGWGRCCVNGREGSAGKAQDMSDAYKTGSGAAGNARPMRLRDALRQARIEAADRIGVMKNGRLEQVATPRQLYEAPASRWIAGFVGDINLFEGDVTWHDEHRVTVTTADAGGISAAEPRQKLSGKAACVAVRPEKIRLSRRGPATDSAGAGALNRLDGVVSGISYLGGMSVYEIKLDRGATLRAALANTTRLDVDAYPVGERVVACAPDLFTRPGRLASIAPFVWMALFFLLPFAFVLKISLSQTAVAQPPYAPHFDLFDPAGLKAAFAALSLDNFRLLLAGDGIAEGEEQRGRHQCGDDA
eukprot:gene32358-43226_t